MTPADLRSAREDLGLSQRALAIVLGVPQSTIWRWESGEHPIQHPRILMLALQAVAESTPQRHIAYDEESLDPEF